MEEERSQELVLQTDALPAGNVTAWGYYIYNTTTKSGRFDNFRIKLGHSTRATLGTTYANNYDGTPVQVFHRSTYNFTPVVNRWYDFTFDTPFSYDGRRNLIVELWWKTGTETKGYTHWTPKTGRFLFSYIKYGSARYGYPNAGTLRNYLHYMRTTIVPGSGVEAASLGRVRALYR